ncbi:MAG: cupin domain-containing protein [Actinomycetota bacterium]|nr:cupin domain-containing protein [Actinomycetota bacterium]
MDHRLIKSIEEALGWDGPQPLGREFARGSIAERELCARLLTPTRLLDAVMRRTLSSPQLRCFQDGDELHPDAYLTNAVTRRGQSLSMAQMDRLGKLIRSGCTIVLDAFDSFDPTMEVACRALQWWSRELVQVNTYLTTNDAAGFDLHWDDHDVMIIQIGGEKSWEVRGASRVAPMYRDAEPNNGPSMDIVWSGTMRTGDIMHIPRGYWHQATRADQGDGYSLHLTFGFVKRTGVDWLTWLADRSREHELFRHDLDRWGTQVEQEDALHASISELVDTYTKDVFLAAREQERAARRHVRTFGTFGPPTDLVCVTEFPPHIDTTGGTVDVLAVGKGITFAARAEPAVRMFLSGNPANIDHVTQTTGINAAPIAETLITEGLCAELTDELATGFTGLVAANTNTATSPEGGSPSSL